MSRRSARVTLAPHSRSLSAVPKPPNDINPAVGQGLSQIIMHLLEKEPDDRYQSAHGLIHDLVQLREIGFSTTPAPRVGARLSVETGSAVATDRTRRRGRDCRQRSMTRSGASAAASWSAGPQGRQDSFDRPFARGRDGQRRLVRVAGKFDQYRRDLEFDGISGVSRLGRLFPETDDELAELRERMLSALGPNASMASAVLPEFALLLGVPPETGDPLTTRVRVQHAAVDMLCAVASPKRPVLLFVDDLQWANTTSVGIIDLVLREQVPACCWSVHTARGWTRRIHRHRYWRSGAISRA